MENMNEKISEWPEKKIVAFEKDLEDRLYSRSWCSRNKIDYCNPDVDKAKSILYEEYIKNQKFSKNSFSKK